MMLVLQILTGEVLKFTIMMEQTGKVGNDIEGSQDQAYLVQVFL